MPPVYLSKKLCSVVQILPVDPGPEVVHHPLLDLLLDPLIRLSLQLQRLVVVLPLFGLKEKQKQRDK